MRWLFSWLRRLASLTSSLKISTHYEECCRMPVELDRSVCLLCVSDPSVSLIRAQRCHRLRLPRIEERVAELALNEDRGVKGH